MKTPARCAKEPWFVPGWSLQVWAGLLGLFFASSSFAWSAEPVQIGSRRELFVDSLLIDCLEGVRVELHTPQAGEIVFHFDRPWEGVYSAYLTLLQDGDLFRLYYRGMAKSAHTLDTEVTCMAESKDGIHWYRPNLGLYEVAGTKENNVILARNRACHNFAPFIDTRRDCPADARYKALGGSGSPGLLAFASPDGVHWRQLQAEPVFSEGAFDSQNNAFWSETEGQYVLYFRVFRDGVRWIARTTSKDFIHWDKPVDLEVGDQPPQHLYTNQLVPYPRAQHIYLGFPTRFCPDRRALSEEEMRQIGTPQEYLNDCVDILLVATRGGSQFHRFAEAFLRPGRDLQNWTSRANYAARGIFSLDEQIVFYVQHHLGYATNHLRRYTIRPDGFVSLRAGYAGGSFVTKPLVFSGRRLTLNFSTSAAGSLQVEVQTAEGQPIEGLGLEDCPEIIGDRLEHTVRWKSGSDISRLAGQPIRLRFQLRDADLYSFRFAPDE